MANRDLKKLTNGEKFWLERYHLGYTQERMAACYNLGERIYNYVERDLREDVKMHKMVKFNKGMLCALARRRNGDTLRGTAHSMGISHTELLMREKTSDDRLVAYWKKIGFQF